MYPTILTRRRFLKQTCGLAAGTAAATLIDMHKWAAAQTAPNDYRALVCLFLYGGNDASNCVVPRSGTNYTNYADARKFLTVTPTQSLPISPATPQSLELGLAPQLAEFQTLFQQGKLAILNNVGPLLVPTTRTQYLNGSVPLPPALFAHDEQQEQWQTSLPSTSSSSNTGWGGRMADLLNSLNTNSKVSMSISLAGTNSLQVGRQVLQYQLSPYGTFSLSGYDTSFDNPLTTALKRIFADPRTNMFEALWNQKLSRAIDTEQALSAVLNSSPPITTVFPDTPFGMQMRSIAKIIAARNALGVKRQIFFASVGGFDTHGGQERDHPPLLLAISKILNAFYKATVELGVADKVTTFTGSDFGRTLVNNGQGTDHGWGSHQFILGGAVKGGDCYGKFPVVELDGPDDAGGEGRWIPTTSVDQYAATLAKWFGVSATDIPLVVPNISRFASRDLGFMLP